MPSGRDAAGAGLTLAAALLLTACGGSGTDKAGGSEETPVVLTLANTDSDPTNVDSPDFVEAVEELSGRSVRIRVEFGWRAGAPFDRVDALTIQDVRNGRVDLAVVPARSWDLVGVKSFQALVAPFLVNSVALERSLLASPLVDRMLAGVAVSGVVGLAVLPGALRYPLGLTRRLAAPADYRGAVVGIRPSGVAAATVEALGARSEVYPPGQVVGLDGAELDLVTIRFNGYQHSATAMTGNAVLWPRAMTVVMNRDAFARLGQAQQDALRRAGVRALEPLLRRIETDEQAFLCDEGGLTLATASAHELGALRLAVRPVYAWLERDGVTKDRSPRFAG